MRFSLALLALPFLAACSSPRQGTSQFDVYDSVKVDQMVGNNVSGAVFQRTVVCLNARRETRLLLAVTNLQVNTITNQTVTPLTNQVISISTNYLVTAMTNVAPPAAVLAAVDATNSASLETNVTVVPPPPGPAISTATTVSFSTNQSAVISPNQITSNIQVSRNANNQLSTTISNLSVSLMTNLVIAAPAASATPPAWRESSRRFAPGRASGNAAGCNCSVPPIRRRHHS